MLAFPRTACLYASVHQSLSHSHSFQLQAALPTPRLAGAAGGLWEQERDGAITDYSPPHRIIGSPINRLPSPTCYQHLQTSDDGDLTMDESTAELTSHKKRRRSRGSRGSKGSKSGKSDKSTND